MVERYFANSLLLELKDISKEIDGIFLFDDDENRRRNELSMVNRNAEALVVKSRNALEALQPTMPTRIAKDEVLTKEGITLSGSIELLQQKWVHITLNTLLPHCRYESPVYLLDTLRRLLLSYEQGQREIRQQLLKQQAQNQQEQNQQAFKQRELHQLSSKHPNTTHRKKRKLPFYDRALLVIDEHCNVQSRQVYDQDNKGWKAVSNALKGFVIRDDDQFHLSTALLSTVSDTTACHIYVLDLADAAAFFHLRGENGLLPISD